ncbi:chemotaxis protein [Rhodovulum sulfidophilum]|uniref:methyl-accepting chemotaxis protein n=1 Tax=Rhodovulum sulfidophilum TaxID=35806 RepID=UPI0030B97ED1|nr:chemotaxis protein [Rhodovulum sulfidophilum]
MAHLFGTVSGKLLFVTGVAVSAIVLGHSLYSGWQSSQRVNREVMELASEKAGLLAQKVAGQITEATSVGSAMGGALAGYIETGRATRPDIIAMIGGVPGQYDNIFGAWMAGIPDGPTNQLLSGEGGLNPEGIFAPWWHKSDSGGLSYATFTVKTDNEWYTLPLSTGRSGITEPYMSEGGFLMTSVTLPVRVDGQIVGIAGVDIGLGDLTATMNDMTAFEGGRSMLVSQGGNWLASADPADLNQPYDESGGKLISAALADGRMRVISDMPDGATRLVYPFTAPGMNTTWAALVDVPAEVFSAPVRAEFVRTMTGGALILAMALGTLYLASMAMVRRPLARMLVAVDELATGDYARPVPGRERRDEIGAMAGSVEALREGLLEKNELEREQEQLRGEQERVVADLASGLRSLSEGDLTSTIDTRFAEDYEQLRQDFNATVETLNALMGEIVENATEITTRAEEISGASDDLSRRTENQAATLEQTAAAMDEMTASVRAAAEGAAKVEDVVREARGNAEQSGLVVREAIGAMSEIKKSSDGINQIIGVIDDIAFQTNLLALNAGVEAARAGEAGRGFAVVASEVRALAQRSSEAAKEIKTLISASSDQVETGVSLVNRGGAALTDIVERVGNIAALIADIATGAQEQSVGLGEINVGVNELDKVTQQNAAMVEEANAAAVTMKQEAGNLQTLVARFRLKGPAASVSVRPRTETAISATAPTPAAEFEPPKRAVNDAGWQDF